MVDSVSQVRRSLLISFGFLILIMVALVINAWWDRSHAREHIDEILQVSVQKLVLAKRINEAATERMLLLYTAADTKDAFDRDDLLQHFHKQARIIVSAREAFDRLGISTDEATELKRSYALRNEMYQIQSQVLELLENDQLELAMQIIRTDAIPKRVSVKQSLNRVIEIQEQAVTASISRFKRHAKKSDQRFFGMLLAAIWLSIIIAAYVIGQTMHAQKASLTASNRAREMADSKANFLANMSHEIRTPLNAIVGTAELLQETRVDKEQGSYLSILRDSASVLLGLVNDILDFSKAEAGQIKLEKSRFALADIIYESINTKAVDIYAKDLDLSIYIDPDLPKHILGDSYRLRQILTNLLGNAEKFTAYGEISVRVLTVANDPNRIRFEIHDSGIGIQPDRQATLFDAFTQVDESTTRRYGGTGLGLAICQKIVSGMNGNIEVDSQFGRGSIFRFEVELQALPVTETRQHTLNGQSILLVCNNTINQRQMSSLINTWGGESVVAKNAEQALQQMDQPEQIIHQIVISHRIGAQSGLELATELRSRHQDIAITLLTPIGLEQHSRDDICNRLKLPSHPADFLNALRKHRDRPTLEKQANAVKTTRFSNDFALQHPLRILIAEDNPINQMVLKAMLERLGYQVALANDGKQALDACRSQSYDLILMDVQMPNMDGVEATQILKRELSAARRPYILAVTAHAMAGDRERYLAAGMDDYLSKPVSADELLNKLIECPQLADHSDDTAREQPTQSDANATLSSALKHSNSDYLDAQKLSKLLAISGEADMMNMLDIFRLDVEQLMTSIENSLRIEDASQLRKACRKLRDHAHSLAATSLAECCSEMLHTTKSGRFNELATISQRLKQSVEATLAEIKRIRHPE